MSFTFGEIAALISTYKSHVDAFQNYGLNTIVDSIKNEINVETLEVLNTILFEKKVSDPDQFVG